MGFIDHDLIQRRFWRLLVGGTPLPDFLMEMVSEVSFAETQSGRSDGHVTFIDTPNKLSQNGEPLQTLNDLQSTSGNRYFFDTKNEMILQIGHSLEHCESFPLVMAAFRPHFPADGDPTLEVYVRDRGYHMQEHRSFTESFTINSLGELAEKIAKNYEYGVLILDDYKFPKGYTVLPGKDKDFVLLTRECKKHARWWKVIGNTLVIANKQKVLNDNAEDARYKLYYRCGDNTIKSFTPNEKTNSGGVSPNNPKVQAVCRELNSGALVIAKLDKEMYGVNSIDWTAELTKLAKQSTKQTTNKEDTTYNIEASKLYTFGDDRVWTGTSSPVNTPEEAENQEPGEAKDEETAIKQLSSSGLTENYDATLETFMFDPFLRIGTKIQVFGLGHRHSGYYRIVGRTISMSRDSCPTMTLMLKRVARPAPIEKAAPIAAGNGMVYADPSNANLTCSAVEANCSPQGPHENLYKLDMNLREWVNDFTKQLDGLGAEAQTQETSETSQEASAEEKKEQMRKARPAYEVQEDVINANSGVGTSLRSNFMSPELFRNFSSGYREEKKRRREDGSGT